MLASADGPVFAWQGRRLQANAATGATTARPAVAPHIETRPCRACVGPARRAGFFVPSEKRRQRKRARRSQPTSRQDPVLPVWGRRAAPASSCPPETPTTEARPAVAAHIGSVCVAADARIGRRAGVRVGKAGVCKQTPLRKQRQRARRSRPTSRQDPVLPVWGRRAAPASSCPPKTTTTEARPAGAPHIGSIRVAADARIGRRAGVRRGEGRRLQANAATEATTARPAVAPHIETRPCLACVGPARRAGFFCALRETTTTEARPAGAPHIGSIRVAADVAATGGRAVYRPPDRRARMSRMAAGSTAPNER